MFIMVMMIKDSLKPLLIMGLILCGAIVLGCSGEKVKATVKACEIIDFNGQPAIRVNIESNKYPITVYLLGPDRRTIDMHVVESSKDNPVILYFGLSGINVKPGNYYIKIEYGFKTIEEKEITVKGPKLQLVNANFKFKKTLIGYELSKVELRLKNVGDCPAYPYWVKVIIDDKEATDVIENYKESIKPGEVKTYVIINPLLYVEKPGSYTATIEISGFGGTLLGRFTTEVSVS